MTDRAFIESVDGKSKPQHHGEIALYFQDEDRTDFYVADNIAPETLEQLKKKEGRNLQIFRFA